MIRFLQNLDSANAPVQPVITLRKNRTFVSQLKVKVSSEISSRVVYQITSNSELAMLAKPVDMHALEWENTVQRRTNQ